MDWNEYTERLLKGKNGAALQGLAQSADGQRLGAMLDAQAAQRAAQSGDMTALKGMLEKLLATPEGQRLAEEVKKAVKGDE